MKGIIRITGINSSKKHALMQHMDSTFIKSRISIFEEVPGARIQKIKSVETHKTYIDIWAPASENDYFVRITSDAFTPFISKKFKLGDEQQIDVMAAQFDSGDSPLVDLGGKSAIATFLLAQGWTKKNDKDVWHSPYDAYQDDDLEKAYFFQEYLLSQQHLTSNIEELNKIRETSPETWEKFCWDTFQKTTKEQWNKFVTEEIMEEEYE